MISRITNSTQADHRADFHMREPFHEVPYLPRSDQQKPVLRSLWWLESAKLFDWVTENLSIEIFQATGAQDYIAGVTSPEGERTRQLQTLKSGTDEFRAVMASQEAQAHTS